MSFKVTEIQIIPIKPNNGLVAFANCVLNESLYLSSIAIHKRLNDEGYRLTYPTKKVGTDNMHLFHPIAKELSKEIEGAILNKYKTLVS